MAVTHFAVMVLIVTFLGNSKRVLEQNSNRGRANNTALHRTSKAERFFPVCIFSAKDRYCFKSITFLLLPPVSLTLFAFTSFNLSIENGHCCCFECGIDTNHFSRNFLWTFTAKSNWNWFYIFGYNILKYDTCICKCIRNKIL